MIIKQEQREYFGIKKDVMIISISESIDDGIMFDANAIVEHEKYSDLMALAEKISVLNDLWWDAEEGDSQARAEHDALEKVVSAEYEKLIGGWETAGGYAESFWEVVNIAIGQGDETL